MTAISPTQVDVLCIGQASYDLVFSVSRHPLEDEKIFADDFLGCGGGPAANAAVAISRLGFSAAFAGYLGQDIYGEKHYQELNAYGINTRFVVRGSSPTPISAILVKQDGKRALINYKADTEPLASSAINFSPIKSKAILFDGHQPYISIPLAEQARTEHISTVLDAGSLHKGTLALMERVDYLVCSEKFAQQYAGDEKTALTRLAEFSPAVVITLGEKGIIWRRGQKFGSCPAFPVTAMDTTGAGDAFHGAFAAAIAADMDWLEVLRYASAAGALCCTKIGARPGMPTQEEHRALFEEPYKD
ncbi:MAG: PfkB family carbohydrate kinase [Methylococcales bacterium]|nr:PfkB family carbohydrate kinase [Methylococcales bacterium]